MVYFIFFGSKTMVHFLKRCFITELMILNKKFKS